MNDIKEALYNEFIVDYDDAPSYRDTLDFHIENIIEYLSNRTCENCKYWKEDWIVYGICYARVADFTLEKDDRNNITSKYFGCNKFERKDT